MGKRDDDEERAPDLGMAPGTRRSRNEMVDYGAITRANREAFEAGSSSSRAIIDTLGQTLKEERAELARVRDAYNKALEKQQELVSKQQELIGKIQAVASQNVTLTLAEGQNRTQQIEAEQKGETTRHAMTLLVTNPFAGVIAQKFFPDLKLSLPKPAGPGNTPREAAERFAASLRSGSQNAKDLLEVLGTYCEQEIGRPGDLGLLLEFIAITMGNAPAAEQKDEQKEAAS